jgi:hypothetical protein
MGSLVRAKQIKKPDGFDDTKTASEIANTEANADNLDDTLDAVFSQFKRIMHGDDAGNWYDDPKTNLKLIDNKLYLDFDYTDVSGGSLSLGNCPDNISVATVSLIIDTVFNGSTTITVGDSVAQGRLMVVADNDPAELGTFRRDVDYLYSAETELFIFFPSGAPTQGQGKIFVYLS